MKRFTAIVVFFALLFVLIIGSRTAVIQLPSATALEKSAARSAPEAPAKTAPTSSSELGEEIEKRIDESGFKSARLGISVISLSDGTTFYSRDANRLFTPASNMKIYTTAVALDLLGADYRWRTSVYSNQQADANGTLKGDLILYGRGAPDLVSRTEADNQASLTKLADDLFARGIRKISGNVIGDESYFRGNSLGDGWQWTDLQWYFGAEASALSIDENKIALNIAPSPGDDAPIMRTSDQGGYVSVENRMAITENSTRGTLGIKRGLSDNEIKVWGEFPSGSKGFGARLSVHNPALWTAKLFVQALKTRGIIVEGQTLTRDSLVPVSQRFDPAKATELAFVTSQPLSEITRITNKDSNNLFAELILRTLGRERGAMIETPEPPGRERGDEESGVALINLWMARAGISTQGLALHDGSGLSRLNLVTPDATARLLIAISTTASGEAFKQSLPIAGKDGTLAGRLKTVGDRVTAKTGSLIYDNSLSGFLTNSEGKVFAFSILSNDQTHRGSSIRLIDEITSLIVGFPQTSTQKPARSR